MRKILAVVLAGIMFFSLANLCYASTNTATIDAATELRLANEQIANEQYQKLMKCLAELSSGSIERSGTVDYYGGAYLNNEGHLVVCVTHDYDTSSGRIELYTSNENVILNTVHYSYNELKQEQNRILDCLEAYNNVIQDGGTNDTFFDNYREGIATLLSSVRGTYIDDEMNALVVQIADLTQAKIDLFCELLSSKEYVVFEEGYTNTTTATGWKPGRYLCTSTSSLSTGYPVYFTNADGERELGFISAGHAYDVGEFARVNSGSSIPLGICIASACSGTVDAALIQITNPNYEVSFTTYYGGVSLVEGSYATPIRGTTLYKEGAVSGRTSGTILSNSASVSVKNEDGTITVLREVILTDVLNLRGDSGGVAYTPSGYIVGSMSVSSYNGTVLNENTFENSYICKYENAAAALNCSVQE